MNNKYRIKMDDISYLSYDGNSYGLSTNKGNACLFNTQKAASNTIKSGLPALLKHYKNTAIVEQVVIIEDEIHDSSVETRQLLETKYENVNIVDLSKLVNEIEDKFAQIRENKDYLNQSLSLVDQEISDIVHYIEFNKFSACEGYKLAKMLQECRLRRREIKNQLKIVEVASTHSVASLFKGTTSQALDNIQNQQYRPRVLNNLFNKKTFTMETI